MAQNPWSNIHDDAYMTDTYQGPGPLGRSPSRLSTLLEGVCGSITFDSRGRIVTVCVGLEGPKLVMVDARTLDTLATMALPPRQPSVGGSIFNDFAGGGYFYLDNRDRAVIPTTSRHVYVVAEGPGGNGFQRVSDYDVTAAVPTGDKIISALPDWSGRIWFATTRGTMGTIDPANGTVRAHRTGEGISNSFAVDETGGVYVVTRKALYRFDAGAAGAPQVTWREVYDNSGISKPGQSDAGSGTTPTLMGEEWVSIADNADPMQVVVYRRAKSVRGSRMVCEQPVFEKGKSSTDQSLIGTFRSMVVENNYGYRAVLDAPRRANHAGARARRHRPRRPRLPHRVEERGDLAERRAQALGFDRARLHLHGGSRQRRPVVSHGARLPDGSHHLQGAVRLGLRLQQQLRAGHVRARRDDVHRGLRRDRRRARLVSAAARRRGAPACGNALRASAVGADEGSPQRG